MREEKDLETRSTATKQATADGGSDSGSDGGERRRKNDKTNDGSYDFDDGGGGSEAMARDNDGLTMSSLFLKIQRLEERLATLEAKHSEKMQRIETEEADAAAAE